MESEGVKPTAPDMEIDKNISLFEKRSRQAWRQRWS
jgi:hypothetical protein